MSTRVDLDVAVVGDGPAGMALAASLCSLGLDVVALGPGETWHPTYGVWLDEIAATPLALDLGASMFRSVAEQVVVYGNRRHVIERPYGVVDNEVVRAWFARTVEHRRTMVDTVQEFNDRVIARTATGEIVASVLVDATGTGLGHRVPATAWQTAYGITVSAGAAAGCEATLMDFRPAPLLNTGDADQPSAAGRIPTFGYVVPLGDRWLIEETVLTASPEVPPDRLRPALQRRLALLGLDPGLVGMAEDEGAVERVRIPMNQRPLPVTARVLPYGAAAGMIHPATGYSVAAALRRAPAVAEAIAQAISDRHPLDRVLGSGVMPSGAARTTQALHRYGARVLLGLDPAATREFFDRFFDLDARHSKRYLQIDTPPTQVAATMMSLFSASSWRLRRSLMVPLSRR